MIRHSLLAGALSAALYFDDDSEEEHEIRSLADALYRRVDWQWAQNGAATVTMGWKPESGFLPFRWEGYDEALLLHPSASARRHIRFLRRAIKHSPARYEWRERSMAMSCCMPVRSSYTSSHMWTDFRGLQDDFMREHGSDYFENGRRATYVQQQYAIQNPHEFLGYGEYCWGLTASEGPGPATHLVNGVERVFSTTWRAALPQVPMMARSLPGQSSLRCRSRRRSSFQPFTISTRLK